MKLKLYIDWKIKITKLATTCLNITIKLSTFNIGNQSETAFQFI